MWNLTLHWNLKFQVSGGNGFFRRVPDYINDQIAKRLSSGGEVFGDFDTVVPTYKILRPVLCRNDLPGAGYRNHVAFAFYHLVSSLF